MIPMITTLWQAPQDPRDGGIFFPMGDFCLPFLASLNRTILDEPLEFGLFYYWT